MSESRTILGGPCAYCGAEFVRKPHSGSFVKWHARKFCSSRCSGMARLRPLRTCKGCGASFQPRHTIQSYCRATCAWEARRAQPTSCTVGECERRSLALGLCRLHYTRRREHGSADAEVRRVLKGSAEERFWPRVNKDGPLILDTPCWLWEGTFNTTGYGVFNDGKKVVYAHRFAYGDVPDGLHLDHLCVNPPCVRRDHLEPVTSAENTRRAGARRVTCKRGHPWTEQTTYRRRDKNTRICRVCALSRNKGRAIHAATPATRKRVLERDGWRCAYGGCVAKTVDHIVPAALRSVYKISDSDERYLVAACITHNVRKGTARLAPTTHAHLVDELNALMSGPRWQLWAGGPIPQVIR